MVERDWQRHQCVDRMLVNKLKKDDQSQRRNKMSYDPEFMEDYEAELDAEEQKFYGYNSQRYHQWYDDMADYGYEHGY
jgi:hypothetical protein